PFAFHVLLSRPRRPPAPPPFPYTTLFRSPARRLEHAGIARIRVGGAEAVERPRLSARPGGRAAVALRGRPALHGSRSPVVDDQRSEEHTSELQSRFDLVCRLLLEKKNKIT